jgi:hypothetical protein
MKEKFGSRFADPVIIHKRRAAFYVAPGSHINNFSTLMREPGMAARSSYSGICDFRSDTSETFLTIRLFKGP